MLFVVLFWVFAVYCLVCVVLLFVVCCLARCLLFLVCCLTALVIAC